MSSRSGRRALAARRRTRPGVSSPASVVRSMHWIAFTSHAAWYSFFTLRRVAMVDARRSEAERLTWMPSNQSGLSGMPLLRGCGPVGTTLGNDPVGTTLRTREDFAAMAVAGFLASPDAFSVLSMMGLVEEEAG